jgi:uncharacterized protein (DUF1778 family)
MVAERSVTNDTKGSINLRIEANTRRLIDEAAAVLGKTRTEFMVESARRQAIDVLLDQRLFVLETDRYDAFMHALDNPPAPGPKLRSLLRRVPAWRK